MKQSKSVVPTFDSMFVPTIQALQALGGSGTTEEIYEQVVQLQVTGKSGDGGIDGVGIARINGFLSFHVLFQCKRYQGSVSASHIRDFRGAMQGRTDKGLFITTGTFTRDAIKEATRDGAPPIDLIDGEQLVQRLKELGLGVKIEMVESIEVDIILRTLRNWTFENYATSPTSSRSRGCVF